MSTKSDIKATLIETAAELYVRALKKLPPDVKDALRAAHKDETHPRAKHILATILRNIEVAEETDNIICQDTGTPIYLLEIGSGFPLAGDIIVDSIRRGCEKATVENDLRPNIVHPITRVNTATNIGDGVPVMCMDFVSGADYLDVTMIPKGSGSENQSFLEMLVPAVGLPGLKRFVLESVVRAGAQPCPPGVIGVGLGGSFDLCAKLAKLAIARPIGSKNNDPQIAGLEEELLDAVNRLGIGPMGLGGDTTALAVHIETAHTHISMLPAAVNCQCWAARRAQARLCADGRVQFDNY